MTTVNKTQAGTIVRLAVVLAATLAAGSANAAMVWSSPTTISGDSDVKAGAVFAAFNFTGALTTVNGVTFNPFSGMTVGNLTVTSCCGISGNGAIFGAGPAFAGLSDSYQALLIGAIFSAELRLTIGGLTSGQLYQVEFWVNDTRILDPARNETFTDGATSGIVSFNSTGAIGGLGQFLIGNFTASGPTEQITVSGNALAQLNGMSVLVGPASSVPEPSTVILSGGCLVALFAARRRRRTI